MKRNSVTIEEVGRFLQEYGYENLEYPNTYSHDIYVPTTDTKIQVFEGWDEATRSVFIFLGMNREDGIGWRIIDADYVFIVTPEIYLLTRSRVLLEFILDNNFTSSNKVRTKKPGSIVIKIPISWLAYALPYGQEDGDVVVFDRKTGQIKDIALPIDTPGQINVSNGEL